MDASGEITLTIMDNFTNRTDPDCDYCYTDEQWYAEILALVRPKPDQWFLILLFVIVFILGICGNFLVCYAVWKNIHLRTVTNTFLVNLSIADFMVILLCLPSTLVHDVLESWFLGEDMCKTITYLKVCSPFVSLSNIKSYFG